MNKFFVHVSQNDIKRELDSVESQIADLRKKGEHLKALLELSGFNELEQVKANFPGVVIAKSSLEPAEAPLRLKVMNLISASEKGLTSREIAQQLIEKYDMRDIKKVSSSVYTILSRHKKYFKNNNGTWRLSDAGFGEYAVS